MYERQKKAAFVFEGFISIYHILFYELVSIPIIYKK